MCSGNNIRRSAYIYGRITLKIHEKDFDRRSFGIGHDIPGDSTDKGQRDR